MFSYSNIPFSGNFNKLISTHKIDDFVGLEIDNIHYLETSGHIVLTDSNGQLIIYSISLAEMIFTYTNSCKVDYAIDLNDDKSFLFIDCEGNVKRFYFKGSFHLENVISLERKIHKYLYLRNGYEIILINEHDYDSNCTILLLNFQSKANYAVKEHIIEHCIDLKLINDTIVYASNNFIKVYSLNMGNVLSSSTRVNSSSLKIELLNDSILCLVEQNQQSIKISTFNIVRNTITYLSNYIIDDIYDCLQLLSLNLNNIFLFWSKKGFVIYDIAKNMKVSQFYPYSKYCSSKLNKIIYLNDGNKLLLLTMDGAINILAG